MIAEYQKRGIPPNYLNVLENIKEKQGKLFWQFNNSEADAKYTAVSILKRYLSDAGVSFEGWTAEEIAERLYNDIFEHSILTSPLKDIWVENIEIRAWNDVRIRFVNGKYLQVDGFYSPEQASEVVHSLISETQQNHNSTVVSEMHNDKFHVIALFAPTVSDDIGVYCSIHKIRQRKFTSQEYVTNNFAVKRELDFLISALQHGISILITGSHNTGKSTLVEFLLSSLSDDLKILAVEKDFREVNAGISILLQQNSLSDEILGLNPDVMGFNLDDCIAQDAGLKGCTVVATALADDPIVGVRSAAMQWWQTHRDTLTYPMALELTCSAFPLVVTLHTFADQKRRISSISECYMDNQNVCQLPLWEYQIQEITSNEYEKVIRGSHTQVNDISDKLLKRMELFGLQRDEINQIKKEKN